MAELNEMAAFVLANEDSTLIGKVTIDAGGKTRFGIAQKSHPNLTDEDFYGLPTEEALVIAYRIYIEEYFVPSHLDEFMSQNVANKCADMIINMGQYQGVKLLQRAVGVAEDGHVGPITLNMVNSANPNSLVYKLVNLSIAFYNTIQGTDQEHEAWHTRALLTGNNTTQITGAA